MEPILSIIVPIYNVSAFLHECIDSILSQTFTDFELILVDDGSTDDCGKICDSYAKSDSRIKVIHKENGGVVSARKSGLEIAKGKYAGYVDGDDWIDSRMYEHMIHYIQKYNCDMVMCDVEHENKSVPFSSGSTIQDINGGFYDRTKLEKLIFPKMLYNGNFYEFGVYPVVWNKLYKREKLINHQMEVDNNIRTGEDVACVYPYLLECDSIYFTENMSLYHYRRSRNQMTSAYDSSFFKSFKALYHFLSESDVAKSKYSSQLDYFFSFSVKTAISNELKSANPLSFKEKLINIETITNFALNCGFLDKIDIKSLPFFHRIYFRLLKKRKILIIVAGIKFTRCIQRIFR